MIDSGQLFMIIHIQTSCPLSHLIANCPATLLKVLPHVLSIYEILDGLTANFKSAVHDVICKASNYHLWDVKLKALVQLIRHY